MSFLAPLFLLGALAIALPIVFHLIRQTTRDRTVFSSLFLLEPTPPRLTRRSRLNNILLLILRCAVLGLLAFGFARPFLSKPVIEAATARGPGQVLILVDTSASMRRAGLWDQAKEQVLAHVRKASPADQLAIYAFDRETRPILSFDEWAETAPGQRVAVAEGRLASLAPGWASSRAGAALQNGAELLADAGRNQAGSRKELVLVSDLQEGSRYESIQGYEWPKDVRLSVAAVGPKRSGNVALQLVAEPESAETGTARPIRFRVVNPPDSAKEQFKAAWMGATGDTPVAAPLELYVPAGQSRTFSIAALEGTNKPTRLVLLGDEEPYDNTVHVVRSEPTKAVIVYLGRDTRPGRATSDTAEEDPKAPLYFLRRAFSGTTTRETTFTALDPAKPLESKQLENASLFIATDLEPNANIAVLRQAVESGKTLLVSVNDLQMGAPLAGLLGLPRLDVTENKPSSFAMFAEIDFKHPLFAPFADPRFADFSKVRFWSYYRVDPAQIPGSRVLAKFDNGDPALLELAIGRGKVVLLTAGWQPEKSQLALSTKFVPLLHTLLEQSGNAPLPMAQFLVGDGLPIPPARGQQNVSVVAPDGTARELSAAGETNVPAITPGVYTVQSESGASRFAVNLDPAESRPGTVSLEDLEKMGAPVQAGPQPTAAQLAARQARLKNAELENRQKLWRYLILGALAVLFVETWLSGRTTRRILLQGAPS